VKIKKVFLFLLYVISLDNFYAHDVKQYEKPRILIVHTAPWLGGDGVHTLNFFKLLKANNYHVDILVAQHGALRKILELENYTYFTAPQDLLGLSKSKYNIDHEAKIIAQICLKNKISLVHCNYRTEVPIVLKAAKKSQIPTVFTYHLPYNFDFNEIKGLTGVIFVDDFFAKTVKKSDTQKSLGVGFFESIPPLFNAEKFILYPFSHDKLSQDSKKKLAQDFFSKTFNISINKDPIIAVVGNMYKNMNHKNYPLLFEALTNIIKIKKKSVNVIIAGDGPSQKTIKQLVKKLQLKKYVNFLGFTDKIPDILHHANIVALASSKEAFGIVFLEAGLMKKPAIGAWGTGAEQIIFHEKTGLLFKKDDALDLSNQIERLLDNQTLAQELGNNAYQHVIQNFLPSITFERIIKFYQKILPQH